LVAVVEACKLDVLLLITLAACKPNIASFRASGSRAIPGALIACY